MSKALVSLAVGPHAELLDLALPSFHAFAERHGYDVIIADPLACDRPPSWWKVPALLAALDEYDAALWLDADTVIVDAADDLDVPAHAYQALVQHETGDGGVPNCGVWYVREPMKPVLRAMWRMEQYIQHGWWEQAAMHDLLGYAGRPLQLVAPSTLYEKTHFLDPGWNVHKWHRPVPARPRIQHASMYPDRVAAMERWAETAAGNWALSEMAR